MRIYVVLLLLFLLSSCDNGDKENNKNIDFFSYEKSRHNGKREIMELQVEFSECGEWGGHEEKIFILTKNDENFYLNYQKYSVDCDTMVLITDSIGSYYAPYKKINDSCTVIMNQNQMNSIYKFSQNLLSAKFREKFPGHAGNRFYLKKFEGFSGYEFFIRFYGNDEQLVADYNQLLNELNLPLLNLEIKNKICDN